MRSGRGALWGLSHLTPAGAAPCVYSPTPEERLDFCRTLIALREEAIATQRAWLTRLGTTVRTDKWSEPWKTELKGLSRTGTYYKPRARLPPPVKTMAHVRDFVWNHARS